MSKERKGLLEKYEKLNWVTMIGALIIGGAAGTTLAVFDAMQIAAIRMYKNIKKKK